MVSGTTKATATAPTITAFSSTFARMAGTLQCSARLGSDPRKYFAVQSTAVRGACQRSRFGTVPASISSPCTLEQHPAGEEIRFERTDRLGRHPGSEELRLQAGPEEHLERAGIDTGHDDDDAFRSHRPGGFLDRPGEAGAVARIHDAGGTHASFFRDDGVPEGRAASPYEEETRSWEVHDVANIVVASSRAEDAVEPSRDREHLARRFPGLSERHQLHDPPGAGRSFRRPLEQVEHPPRVHPEL